jgi:drug/metabolite transporter (DMT)-like permease
VSVPVKRVSAVDLMLLGTVLLWALNITVTRYAVSHGFQPLAYSTTRYFSATALFWLFTAHRERSFRIALSDAKLVALAAFLIFGNQVVFVTAVHLTNASTVGLVLGTTPIFVGVLATVFGFERLTRPFWLAATVSFAGVGLIAAGASGGVSGDLLGDLLAIATAATWACYSVAIAPLMRRYSPFRISALVLALGWVPLALVSIPQLESQSLHGFGWTMALAFGYAVLGPLFLTNILWFTAIARVGAARATLFANLEPFFAVLFAVALLSEHLTVWEVGGGVAIGIGIMIERVGHRASHAGGLPAEPVPLD